MTENRFLAWAAVINGEGRKEESEDGQPPLRPVGFELPCHLHPEHQWGNLVSAERLNCRHKQSRCEKQIYILSAVL